MRGSAHKWGKTYGDICSTAYSGQGQEEAGRVAQAETKMLARLRMRATPEEDIA
jgi:hypothetical protein